MRIRKRSPHPLSSESMAEGKEKENLTLGRRGPDITCTTMRLLRKQLQESGKHGFQRGKESEAQPPLWCSAGATVNSASVGHQWVDRARSKGHVVILSFS